MQYYQPRQIRFGFGSGYITPAVRFIIFVNGIIYLLQKIIGKTFEDWTIYWFGLHSDLILKKFYIWQFFSYMFLHGGFLHILLNMFILWMFGCEVGVKRIFSNIILSVALVLVFSIFSLICHQIFP